MKRIVFIVLILCFISAKVYAKTTGSFELGASYSSQTKTQRTQVSLDGETRKDNFSIKFDYKLNKEQVGDNLTELANRTNIQTNYYSDPWFGFLAIGYERDLSAGIADKTDIGLGAGYKEEMYGAQSGLYVSTVNHDATAERNFVSKTLGNFTTPLFGPTLFREKASAEFLINKPSDYRFVSESALITNLTKSLYFSLGFDYQYVNIPVEGYSKDKKEYMAKVGVQF